MRYHCDHLVLPPFWPTKVGTLHGRNISLKEISRCFFLSVSPVIKPSEKLFQKVLQLYFHLINMNCLNTSLLNIALSFHKPFSSKHCSFTFTGMRLSIFRRKLKFLTCYTIMREFEILNQCFVKFYRYEPGIRMLP